MYLLFLIISRPPLIFNNTDYVMAGVTDGVKCGHTCCSIHDCTIPLSDQQDRFCSTHKDRQFICCIQGCHKQIEAGNRTCNEPSHRDYERSQQQNGRAIHLLRDRLRRAGVESIPLAGGIRECTGVQGPTPLDVADSSRPEGPRGRMSRRWTHNEQLFVFCCGIIVSRATFFGSEGVSGVKVSVNDT
jgi:hypothetical protein